MIDGIMCIRNNLLLRCRAVSSFCPCQIVFWETTLLIDLFVAAEKVIHGELKFMCLQLIRREPKYDQVTNQHSFNQRGRN